MSRWPAPLRSDYVATTPSPDPSPPVLFRSIPSHVSRDGSLLRAVGVAMLALLLLAPALAAQSFSITRTSDDVLYLDTQEGYVGNYASYRITNTGSEAASDVWVSIGGFGGGVVGPASNEPGFMHLGFLDAGETQTAFFYLVASSETTSPQSHTVSVHLDRPPTPTVASQSFSLTTHETLKANANKVESVLAGPNPPSLGGIMTLTVTGETGTLGEGHVLAYTPATHASWRADAYEMIGSRIELTGGNNGVWHDRLLIPPGDLPSSSSSDYEAVYTFRAVGTTEQPAQTTPSAFIASGQQIKHTTLDSGSGEETIEPATSEIHLTKSADTSQVAASDTVTFAIDLINTGTVDVRLDDIVDDIGQGPVLPTYVPGSSFFNGDPIEDPDPAGGDLTWIEPFDVPAGQSRTLSFQLTFPDSAGDYPDFAVGHVGTTQIDSTTTTEDDAPATWIVSVQGEPDIAMETSISPMDVVLPGTDLTFRSTMENNGQGAALEVAVLDSLPGEVDYKLASTTDSLPDDLSATPEFSEDDGASWSYTPSSEGCGAPADYDRCVTHIRWTISDGLPFEDGADMGWVQFIARVR